MAITALTALGWPHPELALAHGPVDQQNEVFNGATQVLAFEPIGQEFTPTKSGLVAVDVLLEDFNSTGAATITARVRSGTIGGAILGSSTRLVPQNLAGGAEFVRFEFPSVVNVTTGLTYVLELDSNTATHGWRSSSGNRYAGGRAIEGGSPSANKDWGFHTYVASPMGDVDCDGIVNSVDALRILRYSAHLSVSQSEPCTDIGSF